MSLNVTILGDDVIKNKVIDFEDPRKIGDLKMVDSNSIVWNGLHCYVRVHVYLSFFFGRFRITLEEKLIYRKRYIKKWRDYYRLSG